MVKSRTNASIKNTVVSIIVQILTLLLMFIQRTFLIKYLAAEYLGIEGLFSNILALLNMVELGFGSALIFSMYKPMAENDENKLNLLMNLYAKIYNIIGVTVLIIGLSITPFLGYLIKEIPNIPDLYLIYVMYVINTGLSYFFVYKSSIITVAQNQYIVNINKFIFVAIQNIIQIIVLILFKNYIIYFLITIICTLLTNISITRIANKKYPFINKKAKGELSRKEKKEIRNYVSAMFLNKIGWIVLNGTDNLLISKFIGVIEVGIYSNYLLIVNAIHGLIQRIYSSITASVGNLGVTDMDGRSYGVFKKTFMITGIIAGIGSISLFVLLNPFIHMWIGDNFLFEGNTVFLIVTNFYLATIRKAAYTFDEAYGLFIYCKYKPVFEAITNLIISIFLSKYIGINGILLGTVISTLLFTFWIEPYVLYKYVFGKKTIKYFLMFAKYLCITVIAGLPCFIMANILASYTVMNFLIKLIFCLLIPSAVFLLLIKNTEEFSFFVNMKNKVFNKKKTY